MRPASEERLWQLLVSDAPPREKLELARPVLQGEEGIVRQCDGAFRRRDEYGYPVLAAVQLDGYDVMAMQQGWGLFNPSRRPELSAWAVERLRESAGRGRIEEALRRVAERLRGVPLPDRLVLLLVPADPAHRNLMAANAGLSAFGSVPGHLLVEVWPSERNLERLPAAAARAFVQGVRWAGLDAERGTRPASPPPLAEHLVLEGLSACLVEELFGVERPWALAFAAPADHAEVLREIAERSGVTSYDRLVTNVYGSRLEGAVELPRALPLEVEDLDYSREVIGGALADTDPRRIAAFLYGDPAVRAHGHSGVGLSAWAGVQVAWQEVRRRRDAGEPFGELLSRPASEILAGLVS